MRIMAIDYGDAHTGIAISDPTGLLAGFTTVKNRSQHWRKNTARRSWYWDILSTWTAPSAPARKRQRP